MIDDKLEELDNKIVTSENSNAEKYQQAIHIFENKFEILETKLNTLERVISEKDENLVKELDDKIVTSENSYAEKYQQAIHILENELG